MFNFKFSAAGHAIRAAQYNHIDRFYIRFMQFTNTFISANSLRQLSLFLYYLFIPSHSFICQYSKSVLLFFYNTHAHIFYTLFRCWFFFLLTLNLSKALVASCFFLVFLHLARLQNYFSAVSS